MALALRPGTGAHDQLRRRQVRPLRAADVLGVDDDERHAATARRRRPHRGLALARAERVERLRRAAALDAVGDVLAERRPVLVAVARAAADEPPVRALGMRRDEEVRVAGERVLADPRADHRRAGECREAARRVLAGEPLVRLERRAVERVRVDAVAGAVRRDLHAEAAEVAVAVEAVVVVAEPRPPGPRAVDAEEEDVAPRHVQVDMAGEESGKPGAAGPDARRRCAAARAGRRGVSRRAVRARVPASPAARRSRPRRARTAPRAGRRRRARGRAAAPPRASAARTGRRAASSVASLSSRNVPSPVPNHATPTCSNRCAPLSASSSRQSPSARSASREYHSASPWAKRIRRVSPPDAERTWPGRVLLDERHVPAAARQLARGGRAEDAGADDGGCAHAVEPNA